MYGKSDAERKGAQREKVKLLNPELYELKKKEERERKLFRLRNKLGSVNQFSATSESPAAAMLPILHHQRLFRQSKQVLEV